MKESEKSRLIRDKYSQKSMREAINELKSFNSSFTYHYNKKNAAKLVSKFFFRKATKKLMKKWHLNAKKISVILDNNDKLFKAQLLLFKRNKAAKTIQRFVRQIQHENWLLKQAPINKNTSGIVAVLLKNSNPQFQCTLF